MFSFLTAASAPFIERLRGSGGWPARAPFLICLCFLLAAIGVELAAILAVNSGHFVYTLDDPYIHLALAEHLLQGHYGINSGEFAAPSSSILWPFLLAPFAALRYGYLVPLMINIIVSAGTLYFLWKIADTALALGNRRAKAILTVVVLATLIPGTNMVGLIFNGMEHSLQVFCAVLALWGMIEYAETKRISPWMTAVVVGMPLVRYENLALSLAAVFFLLYHQYYRRSALAAALLAVSLGGFSLFLMHLGLTPLPTSVLAKSAVVSEGTWGRIAAHVRDSLRDPSGARLFSIMLFLAAAAFLKRINARKRVLGACIAGAIALHLAVGQYGWYYRYEMYIWTVAIATLLYFGREIIFERPPRVSVPVRGMQVLWVACAVFVSSRFVVLALSLGGLPIGSNTIYCQQYQMHRIAVLYGKPVAVNDLGYVSYRNDNYVLDLAGLGSLSALRHRQRDNDPQWMNDLANARNVEFAMIYDSWFSRLPDNWKKIGELRVGDRGKRKDTRVSFYALNERSFREAAGLLTGFKDDVPRGVEIVSAEETAGK